jgi:Tol biopolymer transport system component
MGEIIYLEPCGGILRVETTGALDAELLYYDDLCKDWPEASPDGRWVAYVAHEKEQAKAISLWLLRIDATDAQQVSASVPNMTVNWLPDSTLLYTEYPSYEFDLYGDDPPDFGTDYATYSYDPATKTRAQVAPFPFDLWYDVYRLSPTGDRIAAVRRGGSDLVLLRLDGTEIRTLIRNYSMSRYEWSPDGKLLAYTQRIPDWGLNYAPNVSVIDVETGLIRPVTHSLEKRDVHFRNWSPDGRWISGECPDYRLWLVRVEDGMEQCFDIRPTGYMDYPITWSPDSTMIVELDRASQDDPWDLYTIRVTDGKISRLTHSRDYKNYVLWIR